MTHMSQAQAAIQVHYDFPNKLMLTDFKWIVSKCAMPFDTPIIYIIQLDDKVMQMFNFTK